MSELVLAAIALSGVAYLTVSWRLSRRSSELRDHLPMTSDDSQASIRNSSEFSAATVATTISLATVVLAYTELAGYMGLWLLWTVFTTCMGIFVVRMLAPRIWQRLARHGRLKPTLHEFIGGAFGSTTVMRVAAICTSLGFVGALAVELTVGSTFLSQLAPAVPRWAALIILAGIGITYTSLGGFRAVVVTDRMQMIAIWLSIVGLVVLVAATIHIGGGWGAFAERIPKTVYDFSPRDGLYAFLIGILVINVPTFLGDMSVWQRIAASQSEETVRRGLGGSVVLAFFSWTLLALLACGIVGLVAPREGVNPLVNFLSQAGQLALPGVWLVLLIVFIGMFAASLSTASTQLIAAGHSLHIDVLHGGNRAHLADSKSELLVSRRLLVACAIAAVAVVETLQALGFSIADLVFAVYGSQLGLVPVALAALFLDHEWLKKLSGFAVVAVGMGFLVGWAAAALGKLTGNGDLVFLSPALSFASSGLTILLGLVSGWRKR
jgi:Na+/proline symporter